MRRSHPTVIAATALAALALPLRAHHSLEDTYDLGRTVTLTGVVSEVQWANPHVRLLVEVKGAAGEVKTWQVEIKPPSAMARLGVSQAMLERAGEISVEVWLAKDGSPSAAGKTLKTPDGALYDVASGMNWRPAR
ncbi:MAG TPA: DUF6152 family protein [Gammaproteobacteria bacterium]|nr:DUF6152 family protein [Gammaproteobacteria bacterium]